MGKYKLIIFSEISRHMRGKLFWLTLILLGLASYDLLIRPLFADLWYLVWILAGITLLLWFYYAILMRRAAIILRPDYFILQGPLRRVKISYGRIHTITTAKPSQHLSNNTLSHRERALIEPYLHVITVFVEMNSFPRQLQHRQLWFPRVLFSNLHPGLLLIVADWLALSRALEEARAVRRDKLHKEQRDDKRSLASRVLDP